MAAPSPAKTHAHDMHEKAGSISNTCAQAPLRDDMNRRLSTKPWWERTAPVCSVGFMPLSPFGYHVPRQLLPQPSPPLGWPRRAHAHEPGAATATHRLGSAPTADWVPRDELRPHAQESPETQLLSHDFAAWSALARDRPRWWLLTHSTPRPALRRPDLRSPPAPNQPPANPNAPLPGYGNLAPACVPPPGHAPFAHE